MYGMQMSYVILLPSLIESDIESIDHRSKGSKMVPFPVYYLYVYMLLTENNYYGLPPPPPRKKKRKHSCWVREWILRRSLHVCNTMFKLRNELIVVGNKIPYLLNVRIVLNVLF